MSAGTTDPFDSPVAAVNLGIQDIAAPIILILLVVISGWAAARYRLSTGRRPLDNLCNRLEGQTGVPGWCVLPATLGALSLMISVVGFYWDVVLHIDNGRDESLYASPAHWLVAFGLVGTAMSGFLAIVIGTPVAVRGSLRLRRGWYAPLGGVLLFMCGGLAVLAIPVDDSLHKVWGQDVTLWSAAHLVMIGCSSLSTLALWILTVEAEPQRSAPAPTSVGRRLRRGFEIAIAGGFLMGLSTLQGEFDYGVAQFRLAYQPVLVVLAASIALVAARERLGPGGALAAALVCLAGRGLLAAIIGPILGHTQLHFAVYVVDALLVEVNARALRGASEAVRGAVAGLLIATVGFAAHVVMAGRIMPLPWPAPTLRAAFLPVLAVGVSGAVLGALLGRCLTPGVTARDRSRPGTGWAAALMLSLGGLWLLPMGSHRGEVVLTARPTSTLEGTTTVVAEGIDDARVERADWFMAFAWQGGGLRRIDLERIGPGRYRTERALPVGDGWRSAIRLQEGGNLSGVPIFMSGDPELGIHEVPLPDGEVRELVPDRALLQREAEPGGYLGLLANVAFVGVVIVVLGAFAVALGRTGASPVPSGANSKVVTDVGEKRGTAVWPFA